MDTDYIISFLCASRNMSGTFLMPEIPDMSSLMMTASGPYCRGQCSLATQNNRRDISVLKLGLETLTFAKHKGGAVYTKEGLSYTKEGPSYTREWPYTQRRGCHTQRRGHHTQRRGRHTQRRGHHTHSHCSFARDNPS